MHPSRAIRWILFLLLAIPTTMARSAPPLARRSPGDKPRIIPVQPKGRDPRARLVDQITKPELPWIDIKQVKDIAETTGQPPAQSLATDSASLKANGSGAGFKGGATSSAFSFAKPGGSGNGDDASSGDPKGGGGSGPEKQQSGSSSGGSVAYSKWWPMCLFLDSSISTAEGNRTVKGLVDDAAKCGVNLVVFPVTIKPNYPEDPEIINRGSQSSCNLVSAGIAPKASTSVCVHYRCSADYMCGDPKCESNTAGCAQLQAGAGDKLKNKYKGTPKEALINEFMSKEGKSGASGQAAPSIEDAGACDKDTVAHEAIGHSEMGMPNGKSHGKGIGDPEGGEDSPSGDWTSAGCASLVENAFPNDGRWRYDANRTRYYTKIEDPAKQWDLLGGKQLFRDPPGAPPPGDGKPPKVDPPPPPRITGYDEGAPKAGGNPPPAKGTDLPSTPPAPSLAGPVIKHKPRPGDKIVDSLLAGIQGKARQPANEDDPPPPPMQGISPPPPSPGKAPPSQRITYDEGAPKARASDSAGGNTFVKAKSDPPPSSGGDGVSSASLTYDESAPKGQAPGGGGNGATLPLGPTTGDLSPSAVIGGSTIIKAGGIPPTGLSSDFFKDAGNGGGGLESADDTEDKKRRRVRRGGIEGEGRRAPASIDTGRRAGGTSRRGGQP